MTDSLTPPEPLGLDLVTIPEIAFMTGVLVPTVEYWRLRHLDDDGNPTERTLPKPDDVIGDKPVWRLDRITEWFDFTGRAYDVDAWREHRDAGGFRRKTPANAASK